MALRPLDIGVMVSGADPIASIQKVQSLGLDNCQMTVPAPEWHTPEKVAKIKQALDAAGVSVTCVFCGYPGESYADIPTIHATIGLVPASTRDERLDLSKQFSDFAKAIGAPVLAAHIGFVPEDPASANYAGVVKAVQALCDHCASNGQKFALETGQESATTLSRLISDVNRPNLGVNFDPANMLLYGSGDPIEALGLVGKYVVGVHGKDGDTPKAAGTLGTEFPLGKGKVGFPRFIAKLKEIGYTGPITIEREIEGEEQVRDIKVAIHFLEEIRG